jgi:sigma-E factor negative regulatory protein RseC
MSSSQSVEHLGVIKEITDKLVRVSIIPESACGSCHARGSCSVSETGDKTIEVSILPEDKYSVGEEIKVVLRQSHGIKALALGYVLPFFILLGTLISLTSLGFSEGLAGLVSLLSLAPYYLGLSFFRERLKSEFAFSLKKL